MQDELGEGPVQLVQLASVARRYYLDGKSKVEIADELEISRFRVARLLERARSSGLVRIEIADPGDLDLGMTLRLQEAFALQHCVVVRSATEDPAALRERLGAAAAQLVSEIVTPKDVLGLAWARAVSAMASRLTGLAAVPVVQLTGSQSGPGTDDSSVELVRSLARMSGGPATYFYVPMVVQDAATAQALRSQPEVARAFAQFGDVTKAVAGIGHWSRFRSTLYGAASAEERRELQGLGVCAEVAGLFLTADGGIVDAELSHRLVRVSADQLRAVPEVICIPYGQEKAPAVRAALRSGLVASLVTHSALAHALLADG